jgi:hypothetical protein
MTRYPMTNEQRAILDGDLVAMMDKLGDISILLIACYGEDDPRVLRAGESQAALQRLVWGLDRQDQLAAIPRGAGSTSGLRLSK